MGKNNTIIKQWLSDEGRMASLINRCLFSGKQIFKKEDLKREDGVQGVILRTEDGRETVIERYRDLVMTADDGTKIIILACENQDEIHYGMPVRGMLYDAISYTEQIRELQKIHRVNIINPAEIEDLSSLEESLQMVFGMLKYRKDLQGLKTYVEKNREYFSDIDEESYRAAKMMLGAESYWKDIKSKKENGGMDMCKALEDLRQEGIDIGIERGMKLGEERGVEQGVEIGVTNFIEAFQEMGMSYEDTVRKLQEKFGLTEENAEQKMKECWKIV